MKTPNKGESSMTKARPATTTVTFVDEYAQRYQDLFPDVRSFEAFTHLLMGMARKLLWKVRQGEAG